MKKLVLIAAAFFVLTACSNKKKEVSAPKDTRIMLRGDTINIVKMTDTMIIYESTCRGCAYEQSTDFAVQDSLAVVKLYNVITTDNNPENVEGGSISKNLILVPVKTGSTTIKVIKTWGHNEDTTGNNNLPAIVSSYNIEVRN